MKTLLPRSLLVAVLLVATPLVATAAEYDDTVNSNIMFGLRGGYTNWNNFDQIHVGAHLKLGEILPNIRFTPNIEAGFGDDISIVTFNGDVVYDFTELTEHPWNFYGGGALSFNYFSPDGGDSTTDLGLSGLLGIERTLANDQQILFELRLGIMDSPDLKLTLGYTFF